MFQYFLQYHVSFGTVTFDENWKFTKVRIWKLTSFWDQIYTLGFWLSWISTGFSSSFRFCLITVVRNVLSLVIKCGSVWLYLVELNHISNRKFSCTIKTDLFQYPIKTVLCIQSYIQSPHFEQLHNIHLIVKAPIFYPEHLIEIGGIQALPVNADIQ